jgi:ankyrin repeat protein
MDQPDASYNDADSDSTKKMAFLSPPANTNAMKINGATPLHVAADANQTEVVHILVHECRANTLALLEGDTTALYLASQRGFADVVSILTESPSFIDFVMPEGQPSRSFALVNSDGSLHQGEFGKEGRPWYPPVNTEIGNGATGPLPPSLKSVAFLIRPLMKKCPDLFFPVALHAAVENDRVSVVKVLLKAGAAQLPSMQGVTPLLLSLQYKRPHVALLLLENLQTDSKYADARDRVRMVNKRAPIDGSFPLFVACSNGYHKVVTKLLSMSADVNLANSFGATALSAAVFNGQTGIVSQLLDLSPRSVDAPLDDGVTTAHVSCERGNLALLQQLLLFGADPNAKTKGERRTPLHYASEGGHTEMIHVLLRQNADPNAPLKSTGSTPLHMSAKTGALEASRALLKNGAKPNAKGNDAIYEATPLHLAAQNGHEKVVSLLLKYKADVDPKLARVGVTPFFIAVERGHTKTAKILHQKGANPNTENAHGITVLHMAVIQNRLSCLKLLHKWGAHVESIDGKYGVQMIDSEVVMNKHTESKTPVLVLRLAYNISSKPLIGRGLSPLMSAVNASSLEIVQYILGIYNKEKRLDLQRGSTMLSVLCSSARKDYLLVASTILTLAGSNKKAAQMIDFHSPSTGAPALCTCLAQARVKKDLIYLFLKLGADVNVQSFGNGNSPLHVAVMHEQNEIIQELLVRNAKTDSFNAEGETPISIARSLRNFDILQALTSNSNTDTNRYFY